MSTHAISFFSSVSNNCRFFSTAVFSAKADAKIQPFSKLQKYFFKKLSGEKTLPLNNSVLRPEKIFIRNRKQPRKTVTDPQKKAKKRPFECKKAKNKVKINLTYYFTVLYNQQNHPLHERYQQPTPSAPSPYPLRLFYGCSTVFRRRGCGGDTERVYRGETRGDEDVWETELFGTRLV